MTTKQIPEIEALKALCRKPSLVVSLAPDIVHDLASNGRPLAIIGMMLTLHRQRIPVTIPTLVETGIATAEELRQYDLDCTLQVLDAFEANIGLTRKVGRKRRLEKILNENFQMVVRSSALDVDEVMARVSQSIQEINQVGSEVGTIILEDIISEHLSQSGTKTSWKIPTGFTFIDNLTDGGPSQNDMMVVYGQFKNGKTQLTRGIVNNMARYLFEIGDGEKVCHVAHDGGNKFKHAMYYLAMNIQRILLENDLPIEGQGFDRDNKFGFNRPLISPYTIEQVYLGLNTKVDIPQEVREVIQAEIARMKESRQRNLNIYDAKVIKHDIDRMISIFEREYNIGCRVFAVDHAGELGDPKSKIWERSMLNAQILANFAREHDVILIVLSQIAQSGINQSSDDNNPHLQGGNELIIKADSAWNVKLVGEAPDKRIKLTATFGRFSESGKEVYTHLVPYLASGLICEDGQGTYDSTDGEDTERYQPGMHNNQ